MRGAKHVYAAGLLVAVATACASSGAEVSTTDGASSTPQAQAGTSPRSKAGFEEITLQSDAGQVTYAWALNTGESNLSGNYYKINIHVGDVVLPVFARPDCVNGGVVYQRDGKGHVAIGLLPSEGEAIEFVDKAGTIHTAPALGIGQVPIPLAVTRVEQVPVSSRLVGTATTPSDCAPSAK